MKQGLNELRLEVEVPGDLPNLIPNPSGDKGAWGWNTPVANTELVSLQQQTEPCLSFTTTVSQAAYLTSDFMAVAAGKYVRAQFTLIYVADNHNVKARFAFYDVNKNYLSSSAQSGSATALGAAFYTAAALAPTNTAYVKLRLDFYNGTANPSANTSFTFNKAMVTYSDTATTLATKRTNLYRNPDFNVNGNWIKSHNVYSISYNDYSGDSRRMLINPYNDGVTIVRTPTDEINVTGGKQYFYSVAAGAQLYVSGSTRYGKLSIQWYNSKGNLVSTSSGNAYALTSDFNLSRIGMVATAPTNAATACLRFTITNAIFQDYYEVDKVQFEQTEENGGTYFDGDTPDTTTYQYDWTGTANASTSTQTALGDVFAYNDPNGWQNILGPTNTIKVTRNALDVGILSATVLDALLDPAVADTIRPGKKVRLSALTDVANDVWDSVYEGTLFNAKTTYDKAKAVNGQVQTRIEVTASDNISKLANQGESRVMERIADLPYILEDKGVPWNCNGSGDELLTAPNTVAMNENASALDQVAVTRDTALGYAWVDRTNTLQAWDNNQMSSTPVVTFSDAAPVDNTWLSYTDIDVNFNTDSCINYVSVKYLAYDASTAYTEEITYGPYQDAASIATWGPHTADFTIAGAAQDATSIQAYATSVLNANGTPQIRCNSLTMPVRGDNERKWATLLDLYSPVAVKYDTKVDTTLRITGIEHNLVASTGTSPSWTVTYTFDVQGSVAQPTFTPSPPYKGTTQDTITFNNVNIKSSNDANTSPYNPASPPPLVVGPTDLLHLRVDGNEIVAMDADTAAPNFFVHTAGRAVFGSKVWQTGTYNITPSAGGSTTSKNVNFGTTFDHTPIVMLTALDGIANVSTNDFIVWPTSISSTGFTLNINKSNTTAVTVRWLAIDL